MYPTYMDHDEILQRNNVFGRPTKFWELGAAPKKMEKIKNEKK